MIVGPGNAYVAEAKRQLFGRVGIDLLAGPTEILVIADETADPELVAADLLGQAEHGPTSPAVLITTVADARRGGPRRDVERAARRLADRARSPARPGATHGEVVVVADRRRGDRARRRARARAPRGPGRRDELDGYLERLRNYGSLFLGEQATVAYGDKAIGTNHVLPTAGRGPLHRRALGRQVPQDR